MAASFAAEVLKHGEPVSSQATASPSIRHERTLSLFTASTTSGKRRPIVPFLVSSRMPTDHGEPSADSRRA